MSLFCSYCGKELGENEKFCSNCGAPVQKVEAMNVVQEQTPVQAPVENIVNAMPVKQKVKGNGLSVAGMVLGIIAMAWFLMSLLSIGNIEPALADLKDQYENLFSFALIGFAIGYTLFSLIPSLVGLPLSIAGFAKHKSGKNIAGLILNGLALLGCIAEIVYIMTLA